MLHSALNESRLIALATAVMPRHAGSSTSTFLIVFHSKIVSKSTSRPIFVSSESERLGASIIELATDYSPAHLRQPAIKDVLQPA